MRATSAIGNMAAGACSPHTTASVVGTTTPYGVGIDLGSLDRGDASQPEERTCLFSNVCFDSHAPGTWVYFARDDEFVGQALHAGVGVWAAAISLARVAFQLITPLSCGALPYHPELIWRRPR